MSLRKTLPPNRMRKPERDSVLAAIRSARPRHAVLDVNTLADRLRREHPDFQTSAIALQREIARRAAREGVQVVDVEPRDQWR